MFDAIPEVSRSDDKEATPFNFWQIIRVLQRWWWLIALVIVLLTGTLAAQLYKAVPMYRATTILEVKQEERNVIDVSEVERIDADQEFLVTQIQLLQSRSLIEDSVESLNLLSDPFFIPQESETWANLSRVERLKIVIEEFKRNLTVKSVGRSRLIQVSFEHSDPRQASKLANSIAENYIANGLSRKFNATASAREFLQSRLSTAKTSLEIAERDIVAYATANNIITIGGDDTQSTSFLDTTNLVSLSEELTKASLVRFEAEQALKQSEKGSFVAETLDDASLQTLRSKRIELNSEYLEKLAVFKPNFPDMLELKSRIDMFDREIATKTDQIVSSSSDGLRQAYELALAREQDLRRRVNQVKSSVIDLREKNIEYTILKRQVETERTQYDALLQRLKEVSVSDDLGSNLLQVVDSAQPPRYPFKPNKLRGILLALLLSSTLGIGLAYAIELIDDHIKGPEDVKNKLNQIIMGVIPISKNPDELQNELSNPQSSLSEAYASLRTNLQFSGADGGPRIIQITSTTSGEGKSVTSLATAMRFAGLGQRVLLVDADMRLPTFLQVLGQTPSVGLSGVLTQNRDFSSEVQQTRYPCFDLLVSGDKVPNPSELLASERFDSLLEWAREAYDYIIVDSPPVLGLADAPILGAKVDASLLVVESSRLRTPNVKASLERLRHSGTKVLGVVLTKYKSRVGGYTDYYKYTYGDAANNYAETDKVSKTSVKSKRKFEL